MERMAETTEAPLIRDESNPINLMVIFGCQSNFFVLIYINSQTISYKETPDFYSTKVKRE